MGLIWGKCLRTRALVGEIGPVTGGWEVFQVWGLDLVCFGLESHDHLSFSCSQFSTSHSKSLNQVKSEQVS